MDSRISFTTKVPFKKLFFLLKNNSDSASNGQFGFDVSIYRHHSVVGAIGTNSSQGSSYIYYNGVQQQELIASNAAPGVYFGACVSMDKRNVFVGASNAGPGGVGETYAFLKSEC